MNNNLGCSQISDIPEGLVIKQEEIDSLLFDTPLDETVNKKRKLDIKEENENLEPIRKKVFRKKWLELPEFKGWLTEGLLPDYGICAVCKVTISATKSEFLTHSKTKKHSRNVITQKQFLKNIDVDDDDAGTDDSRTEHVRMIDLRCDSLSLPSKAMICAMLNAPLGDSSFDSDPSVKDLEESVAQMLKKESGLFFPTHTMANLVAVLTHCQSRGSAVIAGEESDISRCNKEALVKFGGLHFCPLTESEDGTFQLDDLEQLLKRLDLTFPLSCLVCFECPHARKGGRIPPLEWISLLGRLCASEDVILHCDGTRLINASLSKNLAPSRFVDDCDSVTFALDKGLGAPIGAVLVGKELFIKRAAFIRNFIGGNIHQAGTLAAAGTFGLNHTLADVDWDHEKALSLAMGVSEVNSRYVSVKANAVHTNIVHLHCLAGSLTAKQLKTRLTSVNDEEIDHFRGKNVIVLGKDINKQTLSLMIHKNISASDVKAVIQKIIYVIDELEHSFSTRLKL